MTKYMELALLVATQSCDLNTKVGCVVVKDGVILSEGYNKLPKGLKLENYPLDVREGSLLETKYAYMLHSEAKAIVDAQVSLDGATIYVTLFPCNECAKLIIESGISEIIYLSDKYNNTESNIASKRMLDEVGIQYRQER